MMVGKMSIIDEILRGSARERYCVDWRDYEASIISGDYRVLIEQLGHEVVCKLTPSTCAVYRVRHDEEDRIIKIAGFTTSCPDTLLKLNHVLREDKVLGRAQGVNGIPQLLDCYDLRGGLLSILESLVAGYGFERQGVVAILKEYIEGNIMRDEEKIYNPEGQAFIQDTVQTLHARGIASLDLQPKNIVIRAIGSLPFLLDLSYAVLRDKISDSLFRRYVNTDLEDLEELMGNRRLY